MLFVSGVNGLEHDAKTLTVSLRLRTGRAIVHLPLTTAWLLVALRSGKTLSFHSLIREAESYTCIWLSKSDEVDCENCGCVV